MLHCFLKGLIILLYILIGLNNAKVMSLTIQQELVQSMLHPGGYLGRPVLNTSQPVTVHIGLEIAQLIVSTKLQELIIYGFFRLKWRNELVSWNVTENNIERINVDPHLVWFPEIILHNSARLDRSWNTRAFKTKISIDSEGVSYWLAPIDFSSSCSFQIENFPYDFQTCEITFGPWSEGVNKIFLESNGLPTITSGAYIPNVEWDIVQSIQKIEVKYYKCCKIPFRNLKIVLRLSRKPLFYVINCIIPASFLLVLLFLGHRLPPQSGERITLAIMISLTFIVMMEFVNSKILPNTSVISSLSQFYLIFIVILSLSIFTTCFVLALYHRINFYVWIPQTLEKFYVPEYLWAKNINARKTKNYSFQQFSTQKFSRKKACSGCSFNDKRFGSQVNEKECLLKKILKEVYDYNAKANLHKHNHETDYQLRSRYIADMLDKLFVSLVVLIVLGSIIIKLFV